MSLKESVFVSNEEELLKLKKYQKIQFLCRNCGKLTERIFTKNRFEIIKKFFCRTCNTKINNLEKYGYENVAQVPEFKEKFQKTNIERYGNICSLNGKEQIKMKKQTWKRKYGVENPYSIKRIQEKARKAQARKKFFYKDGEVFDSSWELAFWIYHKDKNIPIIREPKKIYFNFNNKTYGYIPDFEVEEQLYEIKGSQFFNEKGELIDPYNSKNNDISLAKQKASLEAGVKYITNKEIKKYLNYVEKTYNKRYLFEFCQTKKEKTLNENN